MLVRFKAQIRIRISNSWLQVCASPCPLFAPLPYLCLCVCLNPVPPSVKQTHRAAALDESMTAWVLISCNYWLRFMLRDVPNTAKRRKEGLFLYESIQYFSGIFLRKTPASNFQVTFFEVTWKNCCNFWKITSWTRWHMAISWRCALSTFFSVITSEPKDYYNGDE